MNFFLALCFALTIARIGADVSSVPFFMWSPEQYFTHAKCSAWEVSDVLNVQDVAGGLRRLGKVGQQTGPGNALFKYLTAATPVNRPELVVAFVYSKMSSSVLSQQAGAYSDSKLPALSFLEQSLDEAKSCLVVPYLKTGQQSVSQVLIDALASSKADVQSLQMGGVVACDSIMTKLQALSSLYSNDATDLLLLRAEKPQDMDAGCMKRILEQLATSTQNNLVALVTSDQTDSSLEMDFETTEARHQRRLFSEQVLSAADNNNTDPGLQYVNAPIISGLMLSLLMMLFVWVGVSCLMSIDAPVRFATEALPVVKEY